MLSAEEVIKCDNDSEYTLFQCPQQQQKVVCICDNRNHVVTLIFKPEYLAEVKLDERRTTLIQKR
jgi:hypothetical protein